MPEYSAKVKEHVKHPHNEGSIASPDAIGEYESPICGDSTKIYLKVNDNVITDITWETMGCAASVATSSALSDMAKGKTIEEALAITQKQVAEALDGLPAVKMHCSELAVVTLHEAIKNYRDTHA